MGGPIGCLPKRELVAILRVIPVMLDHGVPLVLRGSGKQCPLPEDWGDRVYQLCTPVGQKLVRKNREQGSLNRP